MLANPRAETETETETEKTLAHKRERVNHQKHGNGTSKTPSVGKAAKVAIEEDFVEFYAVYPRKVGKKAAQKAYVKARHDAAAQTILVGLQRALPGWKEPRFIPYPATWLNRGGWDDQPDGRANQFSNWKDAIA
jgi:hypothetical protein